MAAKIREVRVSLGNKTYLLNTALDKKTLDNVVSFSQRLFNTLDPRTDQEKRLLLGWMYMAYKLCETEEKLKTVIEKLDELKSPEEPSPQVTQSTSEKIEIASKDVSTSEENVTSEAVSKTTETTPKTNGELAE